MLNSIDDNDDFDILNSIPFTIQYNDIFTLFFKKNNLELRDLYEILLRQENPTPFVHQMERKGGRSPTLR